MKIKQYISVLAVAMVGGLTSCTQEVIVPVDSTESVTLGATMSLTGSIEVPEMASPSTRGAFGETPKANLKLTLLEFSLGSNATNSFLTNIYHAEILESTAVNTGVSVKFTAPLIATDEPRVLHLMLADDFVSCNYGSEAEVLPTITTSNNREAYWNRVEFQRGYVSNVTEDGNATLSPEVVTALTDVPMIRNFAKVTVQNNADSDFELWSFELVSVPTAGTIAPYNASTMAVPQLLGSDKQMLSYSEVAPNYSGIMPAGISFTKLESNIGAGESTTTSVWTSSAKYIYEHPFNSLNYTYMIVKGYYRATRQVGYYKLDLGKLNNDGIFEFYDLIRNYNYNVVIESVNAPGATTVSEAISGPVYNNISASVETSNMRNVSDGVNMLFVNETSFIFTTETPVTFLYRYMEDLHGSPTNNNEKPRIVGLQTGDVIKSFTTAADYTDEQGVVWKAIEITPNTPTATTRQQSFTVIDGEGLGRTINLVLHTPWTITNGREYSGTLNLPPDNQSGYTQNVASASALEPLTIYFNLPDGLPESMFPLNFQLEANPQDLENNPIGTLVVSTGPSLFEANNGAPAISYIKTVSWKEYNYTYSQEGTNNIITDDRYRNTNHVVRCRFRTINARTGQTQVMIHNPYFYDLTVSFNRRN